MVCLNGQMDKYLKVIMKIIKDMVKVFYIMIMVLKQKEIGLKVINKVKQNFMMKMEK